jgi:hypothetical protein
MEDVGNFYGQFVYFAAKYFMNSWYYLWSFGRFFPLFGMLYLEKSGNPGREEDAPELLRQGDQMSLGSNRPKHFFAIINAYVTFTVEKVNQNLRPLL